jgi:hypothetical protein
VLGALLGSACLPRVPEAPPASEGEALAAQEDEAAVPRMRARIQAYRALPPSKTERYCAWFGEESDEVLYFGQAAFWSALRKHGDDPRADLLHPGPRLIGRFDLASFRPLSDLDAGSRLDGSEPKSGVWDVLPHAGRVYFTTFFEEAGFVDLESGSVTLFPHGLEWNELALGPVVPAPSGEPVQLILVTRYADTASGGGAIVLFDPAGEVVAEHRLAPPAGYSLAPKTPAWDPIEREIWATTDLLPLPPPHDEHTPFPHPTVVLDLQGREVARFGSPGDPIEIQSVRFDAQGRGYLAVAKEGRLELVVLSPESSRRDLSAALHVVLDDSFAEGLDFAQDIHIGADGSAMVTRWSGFVHRVDPDGRLETWRLPRPPDALYYTAVPAGSPDPDGERREICATRCGNVDVICASSSMKPGR